MSLKRKRVLYVVGTLGLGGIERLVSDLASFLKQKTDWEPLVCCLIEKSGPYVSFLEEQAIPVYECSLERGGMISFPSRFAKLIREVQPDVVHSHVNSSIPWQVLGIRRAGVHRIIFTQHNDYQYWKTHHVARLRNLAYMRLTWPLISSYTAVSKQARRSVAELALRPIEDFPLIYNPIDLVRFKHDSKCREEARREWGLCPEHFVVGNVGRLATPKGHADLLQAMLLILNEEPAARCVIIGEGPLRNELEFLTEKLGLQDKVILVGTRTNIQDYYPAFDCYLSTSNTEGFQITLIEAMACEVPVVATGVGVMQEGIIDDCGIVVPPNDPEAAARAVLKLRHAPRLADQLAARARQRIIQIFGLEQIAQQYLALYQRVGA